MNGIGRRSFLALGALAVGGQGTVGGPAIGTPGDALGDALDIRDFTQPVFSADFHTMPKFVAGRVHQAPTRPLTDPSFRWVSGYVHATAAPGQPANVPLGRPSPAFSSLHDELAAYPNADAIDASGYTPFSVTDGVLTITADRTPDSMRSLLPTPHVHDYVSGALNSYPFGQTYGYFEMSARVPSGRGLWPAFWLLPMDRKWPPEIDVMEVLGNDPTTVYTTLHSRRLDHGSYHIHSTKSADLSADFHLFGVDWGPDNVRFYLDRQLVFSQITPDDWHAPFYLLANLAVGGPKSWPGAPDANTQFPAHFRIAAIRAWQRHAYLDGIGGSNTVPR
jgi:beta-glucanase (GH16 family)